MTNYYILKISVTKSPMIIERTVLQITLWVAGLSPRRLTFKFRAVQLGFVAY